MDTYNFLVSQRLTMILAGDLLEALADQTIVTHFTIKSFTVTKMWVRIRKRTDRTTAVRRAIDPDDAITLRCNHSTSHVNEKRAAARH